METDNCSHEPGAILSQQLDDVTAEIKDQPVDVDDVPANVYGALLDADNTSPDIDYVPVDVDDVLANVDDALLDADNTSPDIDYVPVDVDDVLAMLITY